jgi:hypothetical protein
MADLAWASAIGGHHNPNQSSPDTRGYEIIVSDDGGLVVAGYTAAFGAGSNDMFLTKLDSMRESPVEQNIWRTCR